MKIVTLVGTRPEIIRLSEVIKLLDTHTQHILVHTGQNYDYELNQIFFEDLEIREPDYYLNSAGKNAAETIGNVIIDFDRILELELPDAFLVLGDTNSSFGAICAKKRKIPVFHIEAGNRCFDMNVPEETNRRLIDHLSDINLTYSQIAKRNLLNEGLAEDRVITIGSPMYEVIQNNMEKINKSDILAKVGLEKKRFVLISSHREENVEDPDFLTNLIGAINDFSNSYDVKCIFSTHPRTRKKVEEGLSEAMGKNIMFMKPFSFTDYCSLQLNSLLVASDSGTLSEECSILGFNACNLRTTHERQEMNEALPLVSTGRKREDIFRAMSMTVTLGMTGGKECREYHQNNVSQKILRVILSYTQYINYYGWRK